MPVGEQHEDRAVSGRRVSGPLQGFGQLWQKTYRVRLAGVETTPEETVKIWKERFPEFQPPNSRFYPSMAGVAPLIGFVEKEAAYWLAASSHCRAFAADHRRRYQST